MVFEYEPTMKGVSDGKMARKNTFFSDASRMARQKNSGDRTKQ